MNDMKQYRKKPVTIEAVQFDGLNPTEIKDFVGKNCEVKIYDNGVTPPIASIVIHTLEGDMEVSNGDYVIKGVKGEFYPCKPNIFEQTYESAETQKELEEAAEEYEEEHTYQRYDGGGLTPEYNATLAGAFIAGAEWQKEQIMKNENVILAEEDFDAEKEKSMKWGYNLCKEQMMKRAVEGYVTLTLTGALTVAATIKEGDNIGISDKVRIIIVKEDNQ